MIAYKFKYKRTLFWHTIEVIGHHYIPDQEKMVLYFPDGSIGEIPRWKDCAISLGVDWVLATKQMMEQQAGATVPLNVKA